METPEQRQPATLGAEVMDTIKLAPNETIAASATPEDRQRAVESKVDKLQKHLNTMRLELLVMSQKSRQECDNRIEELAHAQNVSRIARDAFLAQINATVKIIDEIEAM